MMKPEITKNRSTPAPQGSNLQRAKATPAGRARPAIEVWAWPQTTSIAAAARITWIRSIRLAERGPPAIYRALRTQPISSGSSYISLGERKYHLFISLN